tara:strand:+ start:13519 stop:16278 length:2760 start_codon:yes stop_codon:yes gene_type:complete
MKILKILFFALVCFIFFSNTCISQNIKKANKFLEKGDIEKFEETISKAFEKDSLNPGVDFLYAKLYLLPNYEKSDVDVAKRYINKASKKFTSVETKVLNELNELKINQNSIDSLTIVIDKNAYEIALKKNNVDGYENYMKKYPKSKNYSNAFDKRNALVYESIKKLNTWRAYQYFIQSFKGAKEIGEAREKYERLLYEEKTKDKTLGSYRLFLSQNKNTPFRGEIEKNILHISTETNEEKEYVNFLESFPNSKYYTEAVQYLYYTSNKNIKAYKKYFDQAGIYDSLNNIIEIESTPFLAFYENDKYGFIDSTGNTTINPKFSSIKKEYLCQVIMDDFLLVNEGNEKIIINKIGDIIYKGDFIDIENLGNSFIKIIKENKMELVHKSGKSIFSGKIDNAYVIGEKFILIEQDESYELISFTGRKLLSSKFDDVMQEGPFLIFEKNEKFAISNYDNLSKIIKNKKEKLNFYYDDFELVNKNLICFTEDTEELFDSNLNLIIEKAKQNIYPIDKGWITKNENGFKIFSYTLDFKFSSEFQNIEHNKSFISTKISDKWNVYSISTGENIIQDYDSVKLLTDSIIWLRNENSDKLFFSNKQEVTIDTSSVINILKANENTDTDISYIRVSDSKDVNIYSEEGEKLPKMEFFHVVKKGDTFNKLAALYKVKQSEILSMNNKSNTNLIIGEKIKVKGYTPKKLLKDNLFEIEEAGKKGIVDRQGKLILEKVYDGIRLIDDNNISLLKNEKFGVYNISNNKLIEPKYFNELEPYDSARYIAKDFFRFGIIDFNGNIILPFEYQSIQFWNSNSVILKKSDKYSIYNIETKNELIGNINKISLIKDNDEKVIKIETSSGMGVISNIKQEILSPIYDNIQIVNYLSSSFYIAKQLLNEANLLVNLYVDSNGKIIKNQALKIDEKNKLECQ